MSKEIVLKMTDEQEKLMLDMVLDIEQWFLKGPFEEKCANHKKRIANLMRQEMEAKGEKVIPNNEELVNFYFKRSGYKNRRQREEEIQIEKLKELANKNKTTQQ